MRRRRSNERVDIAGIDRERTIEKLARLGQIVRERTFVKPSRPLKTEVQRVGVRGLFRAARLGREALGHPVGKIFLLRIAADICERQHDDRKAHCSFASCRRMAAICAHRTAGVDVKRT